MCHRRALYLKSYTNQLILKLLLFQTSTICTKWSVRNKVQINFTLEEAHILFVVFVVCPPFSRLLGQTGSTAAQREKRELVTRTLITVWMGESWSRIRRHKKNPEPLPIYSIYDLFRSSHPVFHTSNIDRKIFKLRSANIPCRISMYIYSDIYCTKFVDLLV